MKRILTSLFLTMGFALLFVGATPLLVSAETPQDAVCAGVTAASGGSCTDPDGPNTSVESVLTTVVNLLSLVVGIAAVIMIIIGGFKYVTSNGDSASVTSAKNTILYAIIGLVIAGLAQVIVQFVLSRVT